MTESARTLPHPAVVEQHAAPAILRLLDERTGAEYDVEIVSNAIRASELTRIRTADEEAGGLVSYDPAFMNTASCRSSITYIDGERGILRYRGYPIEELAERVPFLDVAWLLTFGDLPDVDASRSWAAEVAANYELPRWVAELVGTFPQDAHPMAVLMSAWSALGAYRPGVKLVDDPAARRAELPRFLASISALAGLVVRHRTGRPAAQYHIRPGLRGLVAAGHPSRSRARAHTRRGPGYPAHPPGRPRAKLQYERRASSGFVTCGFLLRDRRRNRGVVRPTAWRGERGRHPHAP